MVRGIISNSFFQTPTNDQNNPGGAMTRHRPAVKEMSESTCEDRVSHAQHEPRARRRQHWMIEVECVAVKLFPVRLKDKRLHLLIQRRTRIRRQDLEVSACRIKLASKADGCLDALFRVLHETEDIERGRRNSEFPAESHHLAHVLVRDESSRDSLQR